MQIREDPEQYQKEAIKEKDLSENPIDQLEKWFLDAEAAKCLEWNAMSLATASLNAVPSCRIVLLKSMDHSGLIFYTHYNSRKGQELQENPQTAAVIFWRELMRQVIIEGKVEKISRSESESYFAKRPTGSQLGAWASEQGKVITSRHVLKERLQHFQREFQDKKITAPEHWGGFKIIPYRIEFWQGMKDRLHDRFQYLLENDQWKKERLSP